MKQWLPLFSILCLAFTPLAAESTVNLYGSGSETETELTAPPPKRGKPFTSSLKADFIATARIDHKGFHKKKIGYWYAGVDVDTVVYYNPLCGEGLSVTLDFWRDKIVWNNNRYFSHCQFNNVSVAANFFSKRVPDWLWRGQIAINTEVDYGDFWRYTFYDILLWGRFTYNPCIGLHVGFLAQTGQRIDHVYPIVGLDWTFSDKWKIKAVFPMEMAIEYSLNAKWSLALANKFFEVRHRLQKDDRLHRGLVEYRCNGTEIGINYNKEESLNANVHVGYSTGGHFKLSNHRHHRVHRLKFGASPYVGGEVAVKF